LAVFVVLLAVAVVLLAVPFVVSLAAVAGIVVGRLTARKR
jgi:hypothetical protein